MKTNLNSLDVTMEFGKTSIDMNIKNLGTSTKEMKISSKKIVTPKNKTKVLMRGHMSHHHPQHVSSHHHSKKSLLVKYHHYDKVRHIQPYCYELHGYPHEDSLKKLEVRGYKKVYLKKKYATSISSTTHVVGK